MSRTFKMFRRASWLIALFALVGVAQSANAAVNYGDFIGPNIMYLQVTENPLKVPGPTPTQLFGPPTLSGDTLDFNPLAVGTFNALSTGGVSAFTDGGLVMTIMATNNQQPITDLTVSEFGGYTLVGGTPGGTQALASVDAIQAVVTQINGVAVAPIVVPKTITYTNFGSAPSNLPVGGGIQFSATGGFANGSWSGLVDFDFSNIIGATKVELVLDNVLAAMSELDSTSYIDKKDFYITTNIVPEPGALILGAVGGLGLILVGRTVRKKRQVA